MGRHRSRTRQVPDRYVVEEIAGYFQIRSSLNDTSGSADNTIKLWHGNKAVRTYTGHTQAVRGLALIPDIGFASCANDR